MIHTDSFHVGLAVAIGVLGLLLALGSGIDAFMRAERFITLISSYVFSAAVAGVATYGVLEVLHH
jgi:hypothetical protein